MDFTLWILGLSLKLTKVGSPDTGWSKKIHHNAKQLSSFTCS